MAGATRTRQRRGERGAADAGGGTDVTESFFPITSLSSDTVAQADALIATEGFRDADVLLVMEDVVPFTPGPGSPSAEAKIAWVAIDPVLSRYKTMEFRADLWIPASVAAVARAVHEAATGMLTQSDMSRIADRSARLKQRKQAMVAREEALAQEDIEHGKLTGRVVGYELGKLLGTDHGPLVQLMPSTRGKAYTNCPSVRSIA